MTDQLKPNEYWIAGAYSPSLGGERVEHVVINELHPRGRYTQDIRVAWSWAHEDAAHFSRPDQANGAVDWVAAVWAGVPQIEWVETQPDNQTELGAE
jgi:hypothetical protein